jgi:hypothetical protein
MVGKEAVASWRQHHDVGIPGDRWRVERRGAFWFVIDARTLGISAGPYNERARAQRRADELNVTFREARRA